MLFSTKQISRNYLKNIIHASLSLLLISVTAQAQQQGTSAGSASRARYLAELGVIPQEKNVRVEEFVNYHKHNIPLPGAGEAVAVDVQWANDKMPDISGEIIIQIGISTADKIDRRNIPPLNLSLVIDRSGSMADADKLSRVKAALLTMVSQLRDIDTLSLIIFDSSASVLLPAQSPVDKEYTRELIRKIEPGASTNIHAGLMLGYHQALKRMRKDATNRVILLTDGIANTGVTDPHLIARDSLRFNREGIDLSVIGVGLDLDQELLRILAKSGRGLYHFVEDPQEIEKVFIKEFQSLVLQITTNPNLYIELDPDLELIQLYGYEPQYHRNGLTIPLDNMNSGLTQVVMMRVRQRRNSYKKSIPPMRVSLDYFDVERNKNINKIIESSFDLNQTRQDIGFAVNNEVIKNYTIALLSQSIKDMAAACELKQFQKAVTILTDEINRASQRYPYSNDADVDRTMTIAKKYQAALIKYNQEFIGRADK